MPLPGDRLNLSKETTDALVGQCCDLIRQLQQDHSDYFRRVEVWWDWYNAKPLQQRRSEPWPGASNTVIPVIRTNADAITARVWGRMHTPNRTWSIETQNENNGDLAQSMEEFQNREARSTFDILSPTYDWAQEMTVIGRSVLHVGWRTQVAHRWRPRARKPEPVTLSRGPVIEHIPAEYTLWERDRTIAESSVFVRQSPMTWNDMIARSVTDEWDSEAVADCQHHSGLQGPGGTILAAKRDSDGQNPGSGSYELHDIREVWLDWPQAQLLSRRLGSNLAPEFADPKDPQVPIVLTIHMRAKKLLRAVAHPFFFDRWPFLDIYFRRQAGRASAQGVSKILEHVQRGITTMFNQSIDAVTLSNSMHLMTQNPRLKNLKFTPFQPLYVDDLNDIAPLDVPSRVLPDIQLINGLTVWGERVIGLSDPNLGRETRLGGHPSPATNTLVQLEEGGKVLNTTMRQVRQQVSTAGEWIMALYQQFGTEDERIRTALGEADAARLAEVFVSPAEFQFDVVAMTEANNPDSERNKALAVAQANANYYAFILRMLSVASSQDPQVTPPMREAAMKSIEAQTLSHKKFLEASDIDEVDQFTLALRDQRNTDAQSVGEFGEFAQDQLATANAAGGVPNAALGGPVAGVLPSAEQPTAIAGSGFQL